jgi:predicted metal-dependent HD superfamily phosphohydrolase
MDILRESWRALCRRTGLADEAGIWALLRTCYAESHRAYHGLRHIAQLIGLLEEMEAGDELLLAGWFHDAVYHRGSTGNEADSAALAADCLRRNGLDEARIATVGAAILATATHRPLARYAPLLDADLAILGAAPADYAAYRAGIRREYSAAPEAAFRAGRLAFVRAMLARPAIYQTPHCRALFESAARHNLAAECTELEAEVVAGAGAATDPAP